MDIEKLKEFLSPLDNRQRGAILVSQEGMLKRAGIDCVKHSYMELSKLDTKNCISFEDMGIVWIMEFKLIK